jgi:hypothetical protein
LKRALTTRVDFFIQQGDARLADLLQTLADCPTSRSFACTIDATRFL